jgi:hypothetical protein
MPSVDTEDEVAFPKTMLLELSTPDVVATFSTVLVMVEVVVAVKVEVVVSVCEPLSTARYPMPKLSTTRIAMTAAVASFLMASSGFDVGGGY